jgi:ketosteroid isomerase-like protein
MKQLTLLSILGLALALGCAPQAAELSDEDLAAIRQQFDDVVRHLSANDRVAWANDFTEDGLFMIGNSPMVRGRAAIQAWGESGPAVASIAFSDIEIHGRGDLAWAISTYTRTVEGVPEMDRGKQLVVLERQPDGSWLTKAANVSTDLPLPAN